MARIKYAQGFTPIRGRKGIIVYDLFKNTHRIRNRLRPINPDLIGNDAVRRRRAVGRKLYDLVRGPTYPPNWWGYSPGYVNRRLVNRYSWINQARRVSGVGSRALFIEKYSLAGVPDPEALPGFQWSPFAALRYTVLSGWQFRLLASSTGYRLDPVAIRLPSRDYFFGWVAVYIPVAFFSEELDVDDVEPDDVVTTVGYQGGRSVYEFQLKPGDYFLFASCVTAQRNVRYTNSYDWWSIYVKRQAITA